jgi:hypothetical protein
VQNDERMSPHAIGDTQGRDLSAGSLPDAEQVPARVAHLASESQLGPVLGVRKLANPLLTIAIRLVVGTVVLLVGGVLLGHLQAGILWLLGLVVAATVLFTVVWAAVGIVGAVVLGVQATYLFERGIVHSRNWRLRVVIWPDVTALRAVTGKRAYEGRVLGYNVVPRRGRPIRIYMRPHSGRDYFVDQLIALLQKDGTPREMVLN